MVTAYFLPPNTLCPYGRTNKHGISTINAKGEAARLNKRKHGGSNVCCAGCGGRHTKEHFKDKDEIAYKIFESALKARKDSTDDVKNESSIPISKAENNKVITDELSMPLPQAPKKLGRPPKPLNENKHILEFQKCKDQFIKNANNIADCFQQKVDSKQKKIKESGKKAHISDTLKRMVWINRFGKGIIHGMCPVCNINIIDLGSFACGHIFPENYGGDLEIDNLMPLCSECNSLMADSHLYSFAWKRFKRVLFSVV